MSIWSQHYAQDLANKFHNAWQRRTLREQSCVNVMAGIPDPAAYVAAFEAMFACLEWAEGTGLLEHGGMGDLIRKDLQAARTARGDVA